MNVRLIGITKMEDKVSKKTQREINANICYIAYKSDNTKGFVTKEMFISSNLLRYDDAEVGADYDIATNFDGRIEKVQFVKSNKAL